MLMPTLDEFIRRDIQWAKTNAHVDEPDFDHLYVRIGPRVIVPLSGPLKKYPKVLDLANLAVDEDKRGQGVFTRLVARLRKDYPNLSLFVENALDERFHKLLLRLGFEEVKYNCFFLKSPQGEPDVQPEPELR